MQPFSNCPEPSAVKRRRAWLTFASGFDEDGRFRIEDVAPGTYELKIPVSLPSDRSDLGHLTRQRWVRRRSP